MPLRENHVVGFERWLPAVERNGRGLCSGVVGVVAAGEVAPNELRGADVDAAEMTSSSSSGLGEIENGTRAG